MSKIKFTEAISFVGTTPAPFEDEKKYISTGAVDKFSIDEKEIEMITYGKRPSRANLAVRTGDIIFAKMAETLKTLYIDDELSKNIYSTGFCAVRANESVLTPQCLYYLVSSPAFLLQKDKHASGATQRAITNNGMTNIIVNIPPLKDQKDCVRKLDAISLLIAYRKKQLVQFDKLVKSQFIEMFGGYSLRNKQSDWVKISSVAEIVGGSTPKTENAEYWGGKHNWITPAEISDDSFIVYKTQRTLTGAGVKSCSLRLLPIGTVLLSSRAPIGKVAITGVEMYCNQGFKNLICGQSLNSIYIYYLLKFNSEYLNSLGRGATFKEISKSIVDNIAIPVPEIELQNRFAAFVEQTDKSKFELEQSLAELTATYKRIISENLG